MTTAFEDQIALLLRRIRDGQTVPEDSFIVVEDSKAGMALSIEVNNEKRAKSPKKNRSN